MKIILIFASNFRLFQEDNGALSILEKSILETCDIQPTGFGKLAYRGKLSRLVIKYLGIKAKKVWGKEPFYDTNFASKKSIDLIILYSKWNRQTRKTFAYHAEVWRCIGVAKTSSTSTCYGRNYRSCWWPHIWRRRLCCRSRWI